MNIEQKIKPYKIVFDHRETNERYCEIAAPDGKMKRYTPQQVETLKALMPYFEFNTVVFKDYSRRGPGAETYLSDK